MMWRHWSTAANIVSGVMWSDIAEFGADLKPRQRGSDRMRSLNGTCWIARAIPYLCSRSQSCAACWVYRAHSCGGKRHKPGASKSPSWTTSRGSNLCKALRSGLLRHAVSRVTKSVNNCWIGIKVRVVRLVAPSGPIANLRGPQFRIWRSRKVLLYASQQCPSEGHSQLYALATNFANIHVDSLSHPSTDAVGHPFTLHDRLFSAWPFRKSLCSQPFSHPTHYREPHSSSTVL